jgi:hypothetical protein
MFRSNVGGRLTRIGLLHIFTKQYRDYFLKLANDPAVPNDEQKRIKDLLRKPWNLNIRRHSALTQKSAILMQCYNKRLEILIGGPESYLNAKKSASEAKFQEKIDGDPVLKMLHERNRFTSPLSNGSTSSRKIF